MRSFWVLKEQMGLSLVLLLTKKYNMCHASGQILSLTKSYSLQLCSLDFGLEASDLVEGTAFDKAGCLQ